MRFLAVVVLFAHSTLLAQQAEPLLFRDKVHDFGDITEQGGNAEFEFNFVNNSGRTIKIIGVQASCGCTTPGWSKDPIPQGSTGFVKASFDPRGRPGYFNKSLTVATDLEGGPVVLQIKGQVMSKVGVIAAIDYPVEKGSLRFRSNSFNLEKVFINTPPASRDFPVYNAGDKTIHFNKVNGPAYIRIETPKELGVHAKGVVRIIYNARLRGQFGFASDSIEIGTDDENQPTKSFSVYATIEEFFPTLTKDELSVAPVFSLQTAELDFGRLHQGNTVDREIAIKNPGKKELIIRAIQENCSCVKAVIDPLRIKAGGFAKIKISLNTEGRTGIQQKAVTVYTNDPINPVQRVTITAYVD
jgi:hypothetical protein